MVALLKQGAGGLGTVAVALFTTAILVTAQPLSRNGEVQAEGMEAAAGESGARAGANGEGGVGERNGGGPLRFREPARFLNQEAMFRNLDALGGGHLLRDLDPYGDDRMQRQSRGFDSVVGTTFGGYKRLDPLTGTSFGGQKRNNARLSNAITELLKRNFDEIDRSGFDSFVKRNNFDEIDRYGFDGFVRKRRSGAVASPQSSSGTDSNNPRDAETVLSDNRLDRH